MTLISLVAVIPECGSYLVAEEEAVMNVTKGTSLERWFERRNQSVETAKQRQQMTDRHRRYTTNLRIFSALHVAAGSPTSSL
nr:hypothetical protein Iba_chr12dCG17290 [Ipomoea batatas]